MRATALCLMVSLAGPLFGQTFIPLPPDPVLEGQVLSLPSAVEPPVALPDDPDYRIGPDDLLRITVFEFPDLDTSARVTARGSVSLPLLSAVPAAGRTPAELERDIEAGLREGFINRPEVTVFIEEYGSQPVSVMGAVQQPGVYQMQGRRYLTDMLAMAGGLNSAIAGRYIQVIRRPSVYASRASDPASENITIDREALFDDGRSELNITIQAGDTINVATAESIFVIGEVNAGGEYVLRSGRNVTVTQAVALGGGFGPDAKRSSSFVVRIHEDGSREEFPVDLDRILELEEEDMVMLPNDILFVPTAVAKKGLTRALDVAVSVATSRLIWGF